MPVIVGEWREAFSLDLPVLQSEIPQALCNRFFSPRYDVECMTLHDACEACEACEAGEACPRRSNLSPDECERTP